LAVEQEALIHVLISLAALLFAAKIFAELFNKFRLPSVLGELLAGIIVGPFALGSSNLYLAFFLIITNENTECRIK
jgi:Kef-type K+ transport system membrane component KefB